MAVYKGLYENRKPDPSSGTVLSLFVGGQGISCFKLSRLQTDWALMTWISLFLAVVFSGRSLRYSPVFLTAGRKRTCSQFTAFFLRGIAPAGKAPPDFHERHHCSIPSGLLFEGLETGLCSHVFLTAYLTPIQSSTSAEFITLPYPAYWFPVFPWFTA